MRRNFWCSEQKTQESAFKLVLFAWPVSRPKQWHIRHLDGRQRAKFVGWRKLSYTRWMIQRSYALLWLYSSGNFMLALQKTRGTIINGSYDTQLPCLSCVNRKSATPTISENSIIVTKNKSDCLCLLSSAHSQSCLSFIRRSLYRSGHMWENKDEEISVRWTGQNIGEEKRSMPLQSCLAADCKQCLQTERWLKPTWANHTSETWSHHSILNTSWWTCFENKPKMINHHMHRRH